MKQLLSIAAVLMILFVGCSEQTSINAPETNVLTQEPNWISLPAKVDENGISIMSKKIILQASGYIDGNRGGTLQINSSYRGTNGNVTVFASLEFPKGAFEGKKYVTMSLDPDYGTATFLPHADFKKDAIYNAVFTGLDLSDIFSKRVRTVDFVYEAANGKVEYIDNDKVEIDFRNEILSVKNALLPHFSRYGFVR
jgi:hypothetical protein